MAKKHLLHQGESSDDDSSASIKLSEEQLAGIEQEYELVRSRNESLLDEVVFILGQRLKSSEIKVHGIEQRIKTLDSVLEKCKRNGIFEFRKLSDVVGARVVCLFRSDLQSVDKIISENFEVLEIDNKLSGESGPLGYLSVHYLCKMPSRYKGPRYESTSELLFEVQVRTLCMHAWAAVSHYLDYKGDWDVPADLKRALGALSGLFYVADNEFEQFYTARIASQRKAKQEMEEGGAKEINLDTIQAYLMSKFPKRVVAAGKSDLDRTAVVSQFVQEVKLAGFQSVDELDRQIDRGLEAFVQYDDRQDEGSFSAVGAARIALGLTSEAFYKVSDRRKRYEDKGASDPIFEYRHLVKAAPEKDGT